MRGNLDDSNRVVKVWFHNVEITFLCSLRMDAYGNSAPLSSVVVVQGLSESL
jgi:hypothetical protein